jgi:hypothetical protein
MSKSKEYAQQYLKKLSAEQLSTWEFDETHLPYSVYGYARLGKTTQGLFVVRIHDTIELSTNNAEEAFKKYCNIVIAGAESGSIYFPQD